MFYLDKLIFNWIYNLCESIGEFFYCGALEGFILIMMIVITFYYTIQEKGAK